MKIIDKERAILGSLMLNILLVLNKLIVVVSLLTMRSPRYMPSTRRPIHVMETFLAWYQYCTKAVRMIRKLENKENDKTTSRIR